MVHVPRREGDTFGTDTHRCQTRTATHDVRVIVDDGRTVSPREGVLDAELREKTVTGTGVVNQNPDDEGDSLRLG